MEHDVSRTWGNWDHIVVGRAGVFAIETKWTSTAATVEGDMLRFGRITYSGKSFRGAAKDLRDALASVTGVAPWVDSVVVIWGEFEQGFVQGDRVTFISGPKLADWLQGQEKMRYSEARSEELAKAVRTLADTSASTPVVGERSGVGA